MSKKYGEWLSGQLVSTKMSRSELAGLLHVNPSTVSGWVKGRMLPRLDKALQIQDIFGVPYAELENYGYDIPRMLMSEESLIISPRHEAYKLLSFLYHNPKSAKQVEYIIAAALGLHDDRTRLGGELEELEAPAGHQNGSDKS